MKTPASRSGAPGRLAWVACAALALSACTGPGLEPPDQSPNSAHGPGKQSDAGVQQGGSDPDGTGTGGRSPTGGSSNPSSGGAGKGGAGSGGSAGQHNPPETTQDAGIAPDAGDAGDAGDEDAG